MSYAQKSGSYDTRGSRNSAATELRENSLLFSLTPLTPLLTLAALSLRFSPAVINCSSTALRQTSTFTVTRGMAFGKGTIGRKWRISRFLFPSSRREDSGTRFDEPERYASWSPLDDWEHHDKRQRRITLNGAFQAGNRFAAEDGKRKWDQPLLIALFYWFSL